MVTTEDEISQIHGLFLIGFREIHTVPVTPAATSTFSNSEGLRPQTENGSWESVLKELGDSDPEESITGVIFQYSHHFFACLERMFSSLITRRFDPPLRQASPITPSPTPSLVRSSSQNTMKDSPVPSTAKDKVITSILQLLIAIRSQSSPSMKKNLELVGEKSPQLFPEPELIEATFHEFFNGHKLDGDDDYPQNDHAEDGDDLLKTLFFGFPINDKLRDLSVDDDVLWPAPKRVFQLSISMDIK